jgi:hypothetical protein
MLTFMLGATRTGAREASTTAVTGQSAIPAAMRASRLAVAGATMTRSARSATWMWPISDSCVRSKRSVMTGCPESAWKVSGPTNSRARDVMTTRTRASALLSRRTSSTAL